MPGPCTGVEFDHRSGHEVGGAMAKNIEAGFGRRFEGESGLGRVVDDVIGHGVEL